MANIGALAIARDWARLRLIEFADLCGRAHRVHHCIVAPHSLASLGGLLVFAGSHCFCCCTLRCIICVHHHVGWLVFFWLAHLKHILTYQVYHTQQCLYILLSIYLFACACLANSQLYLPINLIHRIYSRATFLFALKLILPNKAIIRDLASSGFCWWVLI